MTCGSRDLTGFEVIKGEEPELLSGLRRTFCLRLRIAPHRQLGIVPRTRRQRDKTVVQHTRYGPTGFRSARTKREGAGLALTGHPRKGAPGPESKFTCRHCMWAPGRQSRQYGAQREKNKVGEGIEGAPGLAPWRGKGRSGTEGEGCAMFAWCGFKASPGPVCLLL